MIGNDVLSGFSRPYRRRLLNAERTRRKSGDWGEWEKISILGGSLGGRSWLRQVHTAFRNKVFSVLVRDAGDGVTHHAISSLTCERPSWHEMQRIKDELAGEAATAVEVYPPHAEIVDGADMFHFWVLPEALAFSLTSKN